MRALYPKVDDPWYTTAEAATYLGVAPGTIRNLVCSGALPPRHGPPGTRLRFRRSELDAYAEGRRS
jgi:excisionase family DNA binding protein